MLKKENKKSTTLKKFPNWEISGKKYKHEILFLWTIPYLTKREKQSQWLFSFIYNSICYISPLIFFCEASLCCDILVFYWFTDSNFCITLRSSICVLL